MLCDPIIFFAVQDKLESEQRLATADEWLKWLARVGQRADGLHAENARYGAEF